MSPPRPFERSGSESHGFGTETRQDVRRTFDPGPPAGLPAPWPAPNGLSVPWQAEVLVQAAKLDPFHQGLTTLAGALPQPRPYTRPEPLSAEQRWAWRGVGVAIGLGLCSYLAVKVGKL